MAFYNFKRMWLEIETWLNADMQKSSAYDNLSCCFKYMLSWSCKCLVLSPNSVIPLRVLRVVKCCQILALCLILSMFWQRGRLTGLAAFASCFKLLWGTAPEEGPLAPFWEMISYRKETSLNKQNENNSLIGKLLRNSLNYSFSSKTEKSTNIQSSNHTVCKYHANFQVFSVKMFAC